MDITNELLATYAENNVSQKERETVRRYLAENPEKMEQVMMLMDDDQEMDDCTVTSDEYLINLGAMLDDIDSSRSNHKFSTFLPMTAMAAQNTIDNLCVIRCEGFTLRHLGVDVSDDELLKESEKEGWLQPDGTALHNIGRLAGIRGLSVSHRYHCTVKDIQESLGSTSVVIAVVNEFHAIIIDSLNADSIIVRDSATPEVLNTWTLSKFIETWQPSSNYLIVISNDNDYIPHPINLDDVEVEDELIELREAIAENAHEVWAESRRKEGWTYGPVRDDVKKQNPDMLPYNLLPNSEKEYDRLMAMNTIKLVKKLGWELKKK